ncbi:hypothetical protein QEN19_002232 [Hanseniaspora menglaensis]
MGVPAFFRWLSKKYPKTLSPVVEDHIDYNDPEQVTAAYMNANANGELHNLYLDMNGLIHPCTHPTDRPAPESEEEMILEVLRYTERLLLMAKPRNLIYMAIDGVAPKAKLNQQRARRFKTAQETVVEALKDFEDPSKNKNEDNLELDADGNIIKKATMIDQLEDEERQLIEEVTENNGKKGKWDSNAITPGSQFMHKLALCLRYWVSYKLAEDPAWKDLKVILSDSNVPGEGEHKIMRFIREQRKDSSYNPNTTHAIYGLDADLVFLALASHEPHFKILREDVFLQTVDKPVKFKSNAESIDYSKLTEAEKEKLIVKSNTKPFLWLHISVLREYLAEELRVKNFQGMFDLERAIDDWVFMCFFCGNDFLPHLPSMNIREKGLELLLKEWKIMMSKGSKYLTRSGTINFAALETFLGRIGSKEPEIFKQAHIAAKRQLEGKQKKNRQTVERMWEDKRKGRYGNNRYSDRNLNSEVNISEEMAVTNDEDYQPSLKLQKSNDGEKVDLVAAMKAKTLKKKQGNLEKSEFIDTEMKKLGTSEFTNLPKSIEELNLLGGTTFDSNTLVKLHESGYDDRYYRFKFFTESDRENCTEEELLKKINETRRDVAKKYLEGISWVLKYYYQSCNSWDWCFPYHYGPLLQDFTDLESLVANDIEYDSSYKSFKDAYAYFKFENSAPILPFEQLMSVMPQSSGHTLPNVLSDMMSDPNSGITEYYPKEFAIDMNGHNLPWLGIPILPLIDSQKLLPAVKSKYEFLTEQEKMNNTHRDDIIMINKNSKLAQTFLKKYQQNEKSFNDKKYKLVHDNVTGEISGLLWPLLGKYRSLPNKLCPIINNDVFDPNNVDCSDAVKELKSDCFLSSMYGNKMDFNNVLWLGYQEHPKFAKHDAKSILLPNCRKAITVLDSYDRENIRNAGRFSDNRQHSMSHTRWDNFRNDVVAKNIINTGNLYKSEYTNFYGGYKSFLERVTKINHNPHAVGSTSVNNPYIRNNHGGFRSNNRGPVNSNMNMNNVADKVARASKRVFK